MNFRDPRGLVESSTEDDGDDFCSNNPNDPICSDATGWGNDCGSESFLDLPDAACYGPVGGEAADKDDPESPPAPCEIDASAINSYIASTAIYGNPKLAKPLARMGQAFIDAALHYDVNPAIIVAIGFQESHWGYDQRNTGSKNAFGLLKADGSHYQYDTWQDGIWAATKTVNSAYDRGNRSVSDLYAGLPGGYCTHPGCPAAIGSMEDRVRAMGEDPDYLGFDCEMKDGVLVKKQ